MIFNGISFPNEIIDAIKDKRIVVFAGAGASVDKPTCLPTFEKLAKEIAEDTGRVLGKSDSCEVFLGSLKSKGIDVNSQAAEILSKACLEHNKLHEIILDVFLNQDDIRIVTTNYDKMFEQACNSKAYSIPVYSAPALPLGSDFSGVVHIHGIVDKPKYMVVTDEDFGRAYLTEGYATRFLVELFKNYIVLFVGYSYNDTILRYLTRAMSREDCNPKYILTDDKKSDWNALGINPVIFPKRCFAVMREGLAAVGMYSKRGLIEWKHQFLSLKNPPSNDLTADSEIDYCLENIERSRVFANSIHGEKWLEFLDRKGVFSNCFSNVSVFTTEDILWANWLVDNFVCVNDNAFKRLVLNHNGTINRQLANLLFRKLINSASDATVLNEYISLFETYLEDSWMISQIIKKSISVNSIAVAFQLLKKLFSIGLKMKKSFWPYSDGIEFVHFFCGEYYLVNDTWELAKEKVLEKFSWEVLQFAKEKILELHFRYAQVNQASKEQEPWELASMDIEGNKSHYRDDSLCVLTQMYFDAFTSIENQNSLSLQVEIINDLSTESILLRRISLKVLRETNVFSPEEKLSIVLDNELLNFGLGKEQVFLLVKSISDVLSPNKIDLLLDEIERLYPNDDIYDAHAIYNWCIWLARTISNNRIDEMVIRLQQEYGFEPSEHPELSMITSSSEWIPDKSPVSEEKLKLMPVNEVAELLQSFDEHTIDGPSRLGLLRAFSNSSLRDYQWTKSVMQTLFTYPTIREDIWQIWFSSTRNLEFSVDDNLDLLTLLVANIDKIKYKNGIAEYLLYIVKNDSVKDNFDKYEERLLDCSNKIWNKRGTIELTSGRLVDATLNTTIGNIIFSWIYMVSYVKDSSIPEKYSVCFQQALNLHSTERRISICMLVGHLNFFIYRDRTWSGSHLLPLLTSRNKEVFVSAWDGVIHFSGRINKDTANIVTPIYYKALKRIKWLDGDIEKSFIDLFLILLIYVVENPTLKFIPEFYRCSNEKQHREFVSSIKYRFKEMDEAERKNWWDKWLKRFINNRKNNKPVELSIKENEGLINLLPVMDDLFPAAVDIICKGLLPNQVDNLLWFSLKDSNLTSKYPSSVAKLTTRLLNSINSLGYEAAYIKQIAEEIISHISDKEKKQLLEALLKWNINIDE
ncbi:MAG: DUF4020 domain-containing protein [Clostridia bacterium]|nr:DUF4020 domain-containing protein [Clostridia bacterium]